MATKIKKRKPPICRNKKKSWRKYIDIQEVEEHLDDVRFEERTGGPLTFKEDAELFIVDNKTAKNNKEGRGKFEKPIYNSDVSKKQQSLKCFQILEPSQYPKVPIQPNKRKIKFKQVRKKTVAKLETQQSKNTKGQLYDIWANNEKGISSGALDEDQETYYKEQTRQAKIKMPSYRFDRTSALKAIEIPDAGASYNPNIDDYQALLDKAGKIEIQKEKEENRIRRLEQKMCRQSEDKRDENWLNEMSSCLYDDDTQQSDNEDTFNLPLSLNPPVRDDDRKTRQKRTRERNVKNEEIKMKKSRFIKSMEKDVIRLRKIKQELDEMDNQAAERKRDKLARAKHKEYIAARLGPVKYKDPDIEVQLPSDLTQSLRELKPEGDILLDRMKSFQRRNRIATICNKKKNKKFGLKVIKKKDFKDEEF